MYNSGPRKSTIDGHSWPAWLGASTFQTAVIQVVTRPSKWTLRYAARIILLCGGKFEVFQFLDLGLQEALSRRIVK
jgi:hypothetical protein